MPVSIQAVWLSCAASWHCQTCACSQQECSGLPGADWALHSRLALAAVSTVLLSLTEACGPVCCTKRETGYSTCHVLVELGEPLVARYVLCAVQHCGVIHWAIQGRWHSVALVRPGNLKEGGGSVLLGSATNCNGGGSKLCLHRLFNRISLSQ